MKASTLAFLAGLGVSAALAHAGFSYAFIFGDPSAGPNPPLTRVGEAVYQSGEIHLTTDQDQHGAMWHNDPVRVDTGFTTTFQFRIGMGPTIGLTGDGFAFVIQNDPAGAGAIGGGGSAMGYGMGFDSHGGFHTITNGLAVEFDTFSFGSPTEFEAGHVAIHAAPAGTEIHTDDSYAIAHAQLSNFGIDVADGQYHTGTIQYIPPWGAEAGHIDVYVDDVLVLTTPYNLRDPDGDSDPSDSIVNDTGGYAYAGFTAATGLADSDHAFFAWGLDDDLTMDDTQAPCAPPHWSLWSWGGTSGLGEGTLRFSEAQIIGSRPLTYRWYKDDVEITDDHGGRFLGLGTSKLVILGMLPTEQGYYRLDAENDCGTMTGFETFLGDCIIDLDDGSLTGTRDGGVDISDLVYFLTKFEEGDLAADLDDGNGWGMRDQGVDINDLVFFLNHFEQGC